jgi:hypothetical protein
VVAGGGVWCWLRQPFSRGDAGARRRATAGLGNCVSGSRRRCAVLASSTVFARGRGGAETGNCTALGTAWMALRRAPQNGEYTPRHHETARRHHKKAVALLPTSAPLCENCYRRPKPHKSLARRTGRSSAPRPRVPARKLLSTPQATQKPRPTHSTKHCPAPPRPRAKTVHDAPVFTNAKPPAPRPTRDQPCGTFRHGYALSNTT